MECSIVGAEGATVASAEPMFGAPRKLCNSDGTMAAMPWSLELGCSRMPCGLESAASGATGQLRESVGSDSASNVRYDPGRTRSATSCAFFTLVIA